MASINLGGWHLPQKKTMAMGHTLNRSNTLPTIPIVLPKKKNMCLKALQKNSSLPPPSSFHCFFFKAYPIAAQSDARANRSLSIWFRWWYVPLHVVLVGCNTWASCNLAQTLGRQLDQKSCHNSNGCRAMCTPLKINMEPQNKGLEDEIPFKVGDFQVPR